MRLKTGQVDPVLNVATSSKLVFDRDPIPRKAHDLVIMGFLHVQTGDIKAPVKLRNFLFMAF